MAELSYSFHVGNGKNAINNGADLGRVQRHNGREYADYKAWKLENGLNNNYTPENNVYLVGNQNLVKNVKDLYAKEFSQAVKEYNSKQTRADRQITNYFNHVSGLKNQQIATELIIQVGSKSDWENLSLKDRQKTLPIFQNQIAKFQAYYPDFKIAQAVAHLDESTPHLHVVGIPVGYSKNGKGLSKKIQKSNVFNKKSLTKMQAEMRQQAERDCRQYLSPYISFKTKKQGRNIDYKKAELVALNTSIHKAKKQLESLNKQNKQLQNALNKFQLEQKYYKPVKINVKEQNTLDKLKGSTDVKIGAEDFNILQNSLNHLEKTKIKLKTQMAQNKILEQENNNLKAQINNFKEMEFNRDLNALDKIKASRKELKTQIRAEFREQIKRVEEENDRIKTLYKPEVMDLFVQENKVLKEQNLDLKVQNKQLLNAIEEHKDKNKDLQKRLNKYKNKNRTMDR
jgi:hypothetical protein